MISPDPSEWTDDQMTRLWAAVNVGAELADLLAHPDLMRLAVPVVVPDEVPIVGGEVFRRWSETFDGALYMPGAVGRHREDDEAVA